VFELEHSEEGGDAFARFQRLVAERLEDERALFTEPCVLALEFLGAVDPAAIFVVGHKASVCRLVVGCRGNAHAAPPAG
jgi:hypothetical protein